MKRELDMPNIPVIATGGLISKIAKISNNIDEVYHDLAIQGIVDLM